jgi:hypothetical protein
MTKDLLDRAELAAKEGRPASSWNGCECDFCTGEKRYEDNWCARCAKVQLAPPKWWENCDVCDQCDREIQAEIEAERSKA